MGFTSNSSEELRKYIVVIKQALTLPLSEVKRQKLAKILRELESELEIRSKISDSQSNILRGVVEVQDDGSINGIAVGVNLGTIIYGRNPDEGERKRLVWYLKSLASKLYRLPLRALDSKLDDGEGISLPQVYVMVALTRSVVCVRNWDHNYRDYFEGASLKQQYDPNWVLPTVALTPSALGSPTLSRAALAVEAVNAYTRLILLGEPGSGKSTFIRHLAWQLAQRGLDQEIDAKELFSRRKKMHLLPIILPLRTLAGKLAKEGVSPTTVYAALRTEMQSSGIQNIDDLLTESLHRGKLLLLLDGLDEVPRDELPNVTDRMTTLQAVRAFVQLYERTRVVITCRTRAFDNRLHECLRWNVETIAPFTLGQIRHFVPAWYRELVSSGQIERNLAIRLERELIDVVTVNSKLRDMASTPLLLTMMALVLYHDGALPRDRPQLYERVLTLLLGQWDKMKEGQNLAEAIGQPDWDSERVRPVLDFLSFQAHSSVKSTDGRGRLDRHAVRDALIEFFELAQLANSWEAARQCLDYFEQRSGLLTPDSDESYVFAHLTLQEHCAGRYMLLSPDATAQVMKYRSDDRWREPLFLGIGVIQKVNPALIDRILADLIDREEHGKEKPKKRWFDDLILATEIGADRNWNYLRTQRVNVDRLQRDLRDGLLEFLNDEEYIVVDKNLIVCQKLSEIGDPRFPVILNDWQDEIDRLRQRHNNGYFCLVRPGKYIIGSKEFDPGARTKEMPQHGFNIDTPFWITRYPITNVQWLEFLKSHDYKDITTQKINWLRRYSNLPVVNISWYMCNLFCDWLKSNIGLTIRLPTEFEWEAAARGGDSRYYPWGNDWNSNYTNTKEGYKRSSSYDPTPVGCYQLDKSPCGALDIAGNVYEWTSSLSRSYPKAIEPFNKTDLYVVRGGSYESSREEARCAARQEKGPNIKAHNIGFRIVLAPKRRK